MGKRMDVSGREVQYISPANPLRLISLLMVLASVGYVCRVDITVAAPMLMKRFLLTQVQMGEVFSAFLIGYTLFQIPSGWFADRIPVRPLYLFMACGWAAVTAATLLLDVPHVVALVGALPLLVFLRFLLGVFAAPTYPVSGRTIAVSVPPRMHGRANGFVIGSIGLGSAAAPLLLTPVLIRFGWEAVLMATAGLALAGGCAWRYLLPADIVRRKPRLNAEKRPVGDPTTSLAQPGFWFLVFSYTLQGYVSYVFVFWFYLYLVQVRHFELGNAGVLSTLPWVCSLVAIPAGGTFSDIAVRLWGPTWGRRIVPMSGLIAAAALLAIGATSSSAKVAVACLSLSEASLLLSEGPYWASMTQVAGNRSGTAGGILNFGGNFGGILSPSVTPWLAARVGWGPALALTALVALVAAASWLGFSNMQPRATVLAAVPVEQG